MPKLDYLFFETPCIKEPNNGSVLVNKMPKNAQYHIDTANSIVFTSKRWPLQPVSSERNHQVADKFRKMSCLNVYGRKCLFLSLKIQSFSSKHKLHLEQCDTGVGRSIIGGGAIFIYSCSALLTSFEIDCF